MEKAKLFLKQNNVVFLLKLNNLPKYVCVSEAEGGQKLVLFQKSCGLSGLFLKQHLTFLAFFFLSFFFFFMDLLPKKD